MDKIKNSIQDVKENIPTLNLDDFYKKITANIFWVVIFVGVLFVLIMAFLNK